MTDAAVTAASQPDSARRQRGIPAAVARRQRTTMSAVARRAQVSVATVSRVLSGVPTVNAAHRARVLAAAAELNYRPNRAGSNLRRQRTDMIGIVVSDIENPHFSSIVRVIESVAYQKGYRVLLCNTDETPAKEREYLEVLADERVLGVILSPANPRGPEISALLDIGIAVVAMDRAVADPRADAVLVDNVNATRIGTEHLIQGGHEHIGLIAGPSRLGSARARRDGYRLALKAARLKAHEADGGFRIDGGQRACERLLTNHPELTALIVSNNLMTIGALKAMRERDVSIPGEIALVAVDDPSWAELIAPPLTVLAQPIRQVGEEAMRLLLERIEDERTKRCELTLPLELRIRQSSKSATSQGGA